MPPTLEQHLFAGTRKRVLALDGGGVRGIITIAFLERLEAVLAERSGRGNEFRLSDYFDLVGGTSVGSILATLIALGYPVAEIKRMFLSWVADIFRPPLIEIPGFSHLFSHRFSSRGLRKRARSLLQDRTLESTDLRTGLAIVAKRVDTGSPWVLTNNPNSKYWEDPPDRSYLGNRHYRLADLVCASTAAPYYFAPKRIRIVPRERRDIKDQLGLFVDGGVSPFNSPALMLVMLAGIKAYGFEWKLGADRLLLVSVGTGSYRTPLRPTFWVRHVPKYFAVKSLEGLIGDSDTLSLTLLQWLSEPRRAWRINGEIGGLEGELLGLNGTEPRPYLSFIRYDARLERAWIKTHLRQDLTEMQVEGLKRFDRPDMMEKMYEIGAFAAQAQVTPDDFPGGFDLRPPGPGLPP